MHYLQSLEAIRDAEEESLDENEYYLDLVLFKKQKDEELPPSQQDLGSMGTSQTGEESKT